MEVVETFRSFVARHLGAEGRAWLDGLPALVAEVAADWRLELGQELTGGLLAYVVEARTAEGEQAVLKVAGAWDRPAEEIACLRAWAGGPAPALLRADGQRGALLVERIRPGTPGAQVEVEQAAALLGALAVPPPAGLRPLAQVAASRVRRAVEQRRARPDAAARALALVAELEADAPEAALVHGDLDDRNLLRCGRRGLVAIDPLPAAGDPAYDAANWAHGGRRPGRRERIDAIAAATGLDRARVRAWASVVDVHG